MVLPPSAHVGPNQRKAGYVVLHRKAPRLGTLQSLVLGCLVYECFAFMDSLLAGVTKSDQDRSDMLKRSWGPVWPCELRSLSFLLFVCWFHKRIFTAARFGSPSPFLHAVVGHLSHHLPGSLDVKPKRSGRIHRLDSANTDDTMTCQCEQETHDCITP